MKECGCQPGFIPAPTNPKQLNPCSLCQYVEIMVLPENLGTDEPSNIQWAPKVGRWKDKMVVYSANGVIYYYDHNGNYVQLSMGQAGVQSVNGKTGIVTLPGLTLTLNNKTLGQYNAGEAVTIELPVPDLGEVAEGNTGYISGDLAYQLQEALQANINAEASARELADSKNASEISQTQQSLETLQNQYNGTATEMSELQETLEQQVQRDGTIFANQNSVTITKSIGQVSDGSTNFVEMDFPMASEDQAGCITAEQFKSLGSGGGGVSDVTKAQVNTVVATTVSGLTDLLMRAQLTGGILEYNNIPANTSGRLNVTYSADIKASFDGAPFVYATPLLTGYTNNTTFPTSPQIAVTDMTENGFSLRFNNTSSTAIPTLRVHWFAIGDPAKTELDPVPVIS